MSHFNEFVGCLLYADDIILLSPSVNELQSMLDVCSVTSRSLSLNFNCSKSFCIEFGPLSKYDTSDMFLLVIQFRGLTQLNILASYLFLVNSFQLTMVLLKEHFILPVIVYLPTLETNENCYNFSYLNRIACQYLLIVPLLWNYLLFKPQILMLVGILYSAKFLVFINGNQFVVLLMVWVNLILPTFVRNLC